MMLHTPHLGEAMTRVEEGGMSYLVPTNPPKRTGVEALMVGFLNILPESVSKHLSGGLEVVPIWIALGVAALFVVSKVIPDAKGR